MHSAGRLARHHALNNMVCHSFALTVISAVLLAFSRQSPDGLILIPWQDGKLLMWAVMVACTTVESYVSDLASMVAQQWNLLLLEQSPSTIFYHILTPSNRLLSKHMAHLMILLMIFLTFLVANLFSFL